METMVLTIPPYNPKSKISDIAPGDIKHPAGTGTIQFDLRIKFDDTPPDGILSQPGFDTFQFAF
ncbi:hypothetical protein LEP3755_43110 [Leptolyngbya sp. NIES-3755]|nr:hypothetical protein LEP3755_43110 [Leptolyngbya sp. NIES-3755]